MPLQITWTTGGRRTPLYQVEESDCRSSILTMNSSTATPSDDVAQAGDSIVSLFAEEACYVAIGDGSVAQRPIDQGSAGDTVTGSRYLGAGERRAFYVQPGDRISGILAS